MRLLIVDDEILIRQSIAGYFSRSDFGFDRVLMAADGEEGLRLALEARPDIIISDVVMPGMSGLDFVQQAKEALPDCEALMISGYEESAYIRQAMRFDVVDYLLKPIDIMELDQIIARIMDRVRARQAERHVRQEMTQRIRDSRDLWASKLLEELSAGSLREEEEVRQRLSLIGSSLDPAGPVIAAYAGVDESLEDMEYRDRQMVRLLMLSAAEREIALRNLGALAALHDADLLGILVNTGEAGQSAVVELLRAVQREINTSLQRTVSIGVGCAAPNAFQVRESCRVARAALMKASLGDRNGLALGWELPGSDYHFSPYGDALQWMQGLFDNANGALLRKLLSDNYADWLQERALALQKELNESKTTASRSIADMAMDIIDERFREPINLQTVADDIGISPNYLSAIFKDAVGENFTVVLTRKRLAMAVERLENSEDAIARIAEETGFGDCNYFGKVFKKAYAMSPGAYRRRLQP